MQVICVSLALRTTTTAFSLHRLLFSLSIFTFVLRHLPPRARLSAAITAAAAPPPDSDTP